MIITFTRTGGFTGIPIKKTINTTTLEPKIVEQIENLVSKTNFFTLEASVIKPHPDRFTYTIAIQNDTISHSLSIHEESVDEDMKSLIVCLQNV